MFGVNKMNLLPQTNISSKLYYLARLAIIQVCAAACLALKWKYTWLKLVLSKQGCLISPTNLAFANLKLQQLSRKIDTDEQTRYDA